MYACVCVHLCTLMCMWECRCTGTLEEGVRSCGARITGSCELPSIDAGIQMQVLWKSRLPSWATSTASMLLMTVYIPLRSASQIFSLFKSKFVYVCRKLWCVYISVCLSHSCVGVHMEVRGQHQVSFSVASFSTLIFESALCTELGAYQFGKTSWPERARGRLCLHPHAGTQACPSRCSFWAFYSDAGEPDSALKLTGQSFYVQSNFPRPWVSQL